MLGITGTWSKRDRRDYALFVPLFNAARQAAMAEFGPRWDFGPQAFVWARLPAAWVRVRVANGTGLRLSKAPRDQKLPVA